ncbi:hypothetical protein RKLH11_38 [Rhodobacteraceae bacterium KLH11]|nr:hypothetical protein RKLH11_38 [Rhodobacteraceae bacterium KLH11]
MKHSDTVFAVVLELAGRSEAISIARLKLVREELAEILSDLDTICADEGDQKPE